MIATDPLNLLAVAGATNQSKGDGDAATWLPPAKGYRCAYVARQVAVKTRYKLWVTPAERDAIARVLTACPAQALPVVAFEEHRAHLLRVGYRITGFARRRRGRRAGGLAALERLDGRPHGCATSARG